MSRIAKPTFEVAKHKEITLREKLGTRMQRELEDELTGLMAQGYKVMEMCRLGGQAFQLRLVKFEDWSLDDLLTEIRESTGGSA